MDVIPIGELKANFSTILGRIRECGLYDQR
jgi:hypothetical protein